MYQERGPPIRTMEDFTCQQEGFRRKQKQPKKLFHDVCGLPVFRYLSTVLFLEGWSTTFSEGVGGCWERWLIRFRNGLDRENTINILLLPRKYPSRRNTIWILQTLFACLFCPRALAFTLWKLGGDIGGPLVKCLLHIEISFFVFSPFTPRKKPSGAFMVFGQGPSIIY